MTSLEKAMYELANSQDEFAKSHTQFMEKKIVTFQIQAAQLNCLEVQVRKMTRVLLEDQQRTLLKFEEPRRVKVDAMELHELVAREEGHEFL